MKHLLLLFIFLNILTSVSAQRKKRYFYFDPEQQKVSNFTRNKPDFQNKTLPYRKGNKWGFADSNNRIVMQPRFDAIFSAGVNHCIVQDPTGYYLLRQDMEFVIGQSSRILFHHWKQASFQAPINVIEARNAAKRTFYRQMLNGEYREFADSLSLVMNDELYPGGSFGYWVQNPYRVPPPAPEERARRYYNPYSGVDSLIISYNQKNLTAYYANGTVHNFQREGYNCYYENHFIVYDPFSATKGKRGVVHLNRRDSLFVDFESRLEAFEVDSTKFYIVTGSINTENAKTLLLNGNGDTLLQVSSFEKIEYSSYRFDDGDTLSRQFIVMGQLRPVVGDLRYSMFHLPDMKPLVTGAYQIINDVYDMIVYDEKDRYSILNYDFTKVYSGSFDDNAKIPEISYFTLANGKPITTIKFRHGKRRQVLLISPNGKQLTETNSWFIFRDANFLSTYKLFCGNVKSEQFFVYNDALDTLLPLEGVSSIAQLYDSVFVFSCKKGKYLADQAGKRLHSENYIEIYELLYETNLGLLIAQSDEKTFHFIDLKGRQIGPAFSYYRGFFRRRNDIPSLIIYTTSNGKNSYYDLSLNRLPVPENMQLQQGPGLERMTFIFVDTTGGKHYGIADDQFNVVVPAKYKMITSYGAYWVLMDERDRMYYMRSDGTILFEE